MKKRTQVHRLPSNDENISLLSKRIKDGVLQSATTSHGVANCNPLWIPQHLYFTTDEEIKEGDWYITDDLKLLQCNKVLLNLVYADGDYGRNPNGVRKIIASTDPKLDSLKECPIRGGVSNVKYIFPKIPQDFIKAYCEQGGIDEVDVECDVMDISTLTSNTDDYPNLDIVTIKVDPIHNTVITHRIEEKMITTHSIVEKMYSIDDMFPYIFKAMSDCMDEFHPHDDLEPFVTKWIKENL